MHSIYVTNSQYETKQLSDNINCAYLWVVSIDIEISINEIHERIKQFLNQKQNKRRNRIKCSFTLQYEFRL